MDQILTFLTLKMREKRTSGSLPQFFCELETDEKGSESFETKPLVFAAGLKFY